MLMPDKPIDTRPDHDDETLSLNQFDSMDEELRLSEIDNSEAFNALLEANVEFKDNKQEPSIPEPLETEKKPVSAADTDTMPFDNHDLSATYLDEPSITARPEHLEETPQSDSPPPQEDSKKTTILIFVIIAIALTAVFAWLNMDNKHDETGMQSSSQQHVLGDDIQIQRLEKKLSTTQQHLSDMEKLLRLKDERIAELTHSLAEQSRHKKKLLIKQSAAKKPTPKAPAFIAPLHATKNRWVIVIASVHSRLAAAKAVEKFKADGITAEINPIMVKEKLWYRIQISGFASKQEAAIQKASLAKRHGINDAWIHRPKSP